MDKHIKKVNESQVQMIELVLPNDTNTLGNLLGGRLMHWIDIAAALAAARHCNNVAVTAAVDNLAFHKPIKLGEIVRLKASVNRTFKSSMEVGVRVEVEDIKTGEIFHSNSAYLTFVNIDSETRRPVHVPEIIPESDFEKRRYEDALKRREQRLREIKGIITE
ncbi:MAG: acyl-CoA thioesterase [Ignavibacteria bacterium]|nr:acyl-CoA thioesterase [Ignavibacteria bacterium]